jgi:FkbM family methyltransferase
MIPSTSQLGQDITVIEHYNKKRRGFFVEIGANDGILLSNTHLLEKHYNWRGICVEPDPRKIFALKNNRPRSTCVDSAIYTYSGGLEPFTLSENDGLYSGLTKHLNATREEIGTPEQIHVKTLSLLDLLEEYKAPRFIEYLSLDTEGSEFQILNAFDFSKYEFGIIDVEHNFIEPNRSQIRNVLESNGYVFVGENHWDDRYRHNTV